MHLPSSQQARDVLDRASGALYGLAVGDALGMPTQLMTRTEVVDRYGEELRWFHAGHPDHPIAAGLAAGTVTDDTEQALLLAGLLVRGQGTVEPHEWASALRAWQADMVARGSADLLGPSTSRALQLVAAGTPPEAAGAQGDTNGAAMRIAPLGVAVPCGSPDHLDQLDDADHLDHAEAAALVDAVVHVSRVTHGTDVGLAAAAAVAAGVSAGVSGAGVGAACAVGIAVAPLAAARGRATGAVPLDGLLVRARDLGRSLGDQAHVAGQGPAEVIAGATGTGLLAVESVPAAFAVLAARPHDPWAACRLAASLGGDSDTIAAIVGAIAGACHGASRFPAAARDLVDSVNGLGIDPLATGLVDLRSARRASRTRDGA